MASSLDWHCTPVSGRRNDGRLAGPTSPGGAAPLDSPVFPFDAASSLLHLFRLVAPSAVQCQVAVGDCVVTRIVRRGPGNSSALCTGLSPTTGPGASRLASSSPWIGRHGVWRRRP